VLTTVSGIARQRPSFRRGFLTPISFAHAITCAYPRPYRHSIIAPPHSPWTESYHIMLRRENAGPHPALLVLSLFSRADRASSIHPIPAFGSQISGVRGRADAEHYLRPAPPFHDTRSFAANSPTPMKNYPSCLRLRSLSILPKL
jgi:hypothetical protein